MQFLEFYDNLPKSKAKQLREAIVPAILPRSSFYAILQSKYDPNEEQRQRLADICEVPLVFDGKRYEPRAGAAMRWRDHFEIRGIKYKSKEGAQVAMFASHFEIQQTNLPTTRIRVNFRLLTDPKIAEILKSFNFYRI